MKNTLDVLVGLKILTAEMVHDYLQLRFEKGMILNIFNTVTMNGFAKEDISTINGCEVSSTNSNANAIEIFFGEKSIRIGMSDENYHGPEAIEYIGSDGSIVIW